MKDSVIRARCSLALAARVNALAKAWDLKPADIIRMAVEDYVARNFGRQNPLRSYPDGVSSPWIGNEPTAPANPDPQAKAVEALEILTAAAKAEARRKVPKSKRAK